MQIRQVAVIVLDGVSSQSVRGIVYDYFRLLTDSIKSRSLRSQVVLTSLAIFGCASLERDVWAFLIIEVTDLVE